MGSVNCLGLEMVTRRIFSVVVLNPDSLGLGLEKNVLVLV